MLVQVDPVQVVLINVPALGGLPAHHEGNDGLVQTDLAHLGEYVNRFGVDLCQTALHTEGVVQVFDKAHLVAKANLVHANLVVLQEDDGFLVHGILALHRASHEVNRVRSVRFVVPRIVDVLPAVQVILCNTIISYYVYNTILLSASISIDSSDLLHYCYELQFI